MYNAPSRSYHDFRHVQRLVKDADQILGDCSPLVAQFMAGCALYHDAYYDPTNPVGSEQASAHMVPHYKDFMQPDADCVVGICNTILATAMYADKEAQTAFINERVADEYRTYALMFLDLDLSTLQLGANDPLAILINDDLRSEARNYGVPDHKYYMARACFMVRMHQRSMLPSGFFHTDRPEFSNVTMLERTAPNSIVDRVYTYNDLFPGGKISVRLNEDNTLTATL